MCRDVNVDGKEGVEGRHGGTDIRAGMMVQMSPSPTHQGRSKEHQHNGHHHGYNSCYMKQMR